MKRITALALLLCLLVPLSVSACAEAAPFRFMTSAMNLVEDWLEEHHPDIKYENLYDTADSWRTGGAHTGRVLDALQSEDGPDLLMLESSLCDFEKVLKSGLAEDLSGHQGIRAALSQMYEPFQSFVTGEDGGIYGVLYGVYGLGMHVIPAAWEAAGLNAADAPQSYEELLDFAGRWAERVEAGEVGDIRLNALRSCGYLMNDRRYTLWLTDLLLDIWIMRHQSAGEALVFNTPAFIALADRARETGRALVKAEKKPGTASLSLYDELFNGGTGYGGPEDLYTNAFPMRLTADEPAASKATAFCSSCARTAPMRTSPWTLSPARRTRPARNAVTAGCTGTFPKASLPRPRAWTAMCSPVNGRMPTGPNGCIFAPIPSIQPTLIRSRRSCAHSSHWGK